MASARRLKYKSEFQRKRRAFYGQAFVRGIITYEEIPKSYRTFKKFATTHVA